MNLADCTPPSNIEWREIAGWPGYRVSSEGRVQSCRTSVANGFSTEWHDVSPGVGRRGHLRVRLCRNGEYRQVFVHTLVLEVFVGPRPAGTEACHYPDPNPSNNRVQNLRWDTRKANHRDSIRLCRHSHGERHGCAKLTEADVRKIRLLHSLGVTRKVIADACGISDVMVSNIVRRKAWAHVKEVERGAG